MGVTMELLQQIQTYSQWTQCQVKGLQGLNNPMAILCIPAHLGRIHLGQCQISQMEQRQMEMLLMENQKFMILTTN